MQYQANFNFIFYLVVATCFACNQKDVREPKVPEVRYEGIVYIGCDIGPYAFNMDSLITFCTSLVDHDQPLDSLQPSCVYDEIGHTLMPDFDIRLIRGTTLNTIELDSVKGNPVITEIPLSIAGQDYLSGEYPYYMGYLVEWNELTLRMQAVNKWVGGCFHDLILWEVIVR